MSLEILYRPGVWKPTFDLTDLLITILDVIDHPEKGEPIDMGSFPYDFQLFNDIFFTFSHS
jgi:hypothetical protein